MSKLTCDRQKPYLYAACSIYAAETVEPMLAQLQEQGVNLCWEEDLEEHYPGALRSKTASLLKSSKCRGYLLFADHDALVSNRIRKQLQYAVGPQVRKSHNRAPLTLVCVDLEDLDFTPQPGLAATDSEQDLLAAPACCEAVQKALDDALHYAYRDPDGDWYEGLVQQLRFLCPDVFCHVDRPEGGAGEAQALSDDFDPSAYDEVLSQQTQAALQQAQLAALQGDAAAQMQLGFFYEMGYGAEQDMAMAANWYRKAAEQDNASAQYSLAELYYRGEGVEQDMAEAVRWFRKAAAQGNRNAQAYLAEAYFAGTGVPQDYAKSARWAQHAAEQGDAKSQFLTGWMYEQGRGVTQDLAAAARWYRKAAENGNTDAMCNLAVLFSSGRGVVQDEKTAVEWFRKAADQDHPTAQYALGMYYSSAGADTDPKAAFRYYQKAAEGGHANAMVRLGAAYENGTGVGQDYAKARAWYEKAMEAGDVEGQYCLGITYYLGHGVPQDYMHALSYIQAAAESGLSAAQAQLGYMYQAGEALSDPDPAKAVEWFRKAADQNNVTAIRNLAAMYEKGLGVPQDKKQAIELYTQASRLSALGWE